jgi:hypothetical protein
MRQVGHDETPDPAAEHGEELFVLICCCRYFGGRALLAQMINTAPWAQHLAIMQALVKHTLLSTH